MISAAQHHENLTARQRDTIKSEGRRVTLPPRKILNQTEGSVNSSCSGAGKQQFDSPGSGQHARSGMRKERFPRS